jgi:hypothetical protein
MEDAVCFDAVSSLIWLTIRYILKICITKPKYTKNNCDERYNVSAFVRHEFHVSIVEIQLIRRPIIRKEERIPVRDVDGG